MEAAFILTPNLFIDRTFVLYLLETLWADIQDDNVSKQENALIIELL